MNAAARRLALACLVAALPLFSTTLAAASPDAAERGRALFHGEQGWQQPPTLAGVALPAAACASCHGASGQGRREGGVVAPALRGGTADRAARLLAAAQSGRADNGRTLATAMPRYRFTPAEREALLAYFSTLGTDAEPVRGVQPQRIVLGALLPTTGPRAEVGAAVLAGLRAHFDAVSQQGGIYGRRVEVIALPWNGDADDPAWAAALRRQLADAPVLALVGSFVGTVDAAAARTLAELRLPMLANLGPALADDAATAGWVSRLLPSVQAQLRGGYREFAQTCPARPGEPLHVRLAPLPGLDAAVRSALPDAPLQLQPANATLPPGSSRRVLALLPGAPLQALRAGLREGDCLWTLAMFSGATAAASPARELLTLPSPLTLPQPAGEAGAAALWQGLGRLAAQLAGEALARAGRRVQPEALAQAQTELPAFDAAPGVSLALDRNRRHALAVTTVWRSR